jgi:DNA-binding winged helix-turn-helix (wHTH) protein
MRNQTDREVTVLSAGVQASESPMQVRENGRRMIGHSRVRLGDYEFDTQVGDLRIGEHRVVLQTQPYKILLLLVRRPGKMVARNEIQQCLWPDGTSVNFDECVNQAISKLRRALRDSAVNPTYVETIGRRGYRLIAPVTAIAKPAGPSSSSGVAMDAPYTTAGPTTAQQLADLKSSALALLTLALTVARMDRRTSAWR